MEFESAHSNTTAKLPILKLGEYEMWVIRIKQYFQVQDYALWEVIENGNSWVSVPQTAQENGTSVTKMSVPVTAKEKTNKKNDVKARSLLLMALPNEHQLTFSQYNDAKTMLAAIETRFGGSRRLLAGLQFWMNKAGIETMSIDDLYNNFKIVKQSVKKSVGASSGAQNLAFNTAPSTSSTNDVNTAKHAYEVSTVSPNDLEKIHEDDLEAIDLKWQLSLLSMRAKRYFQRTRKKIFINANDTVGYDKSKQGNNEDTSLKATLAIDGVGFDWSDMAEEQVQTNMALMAFSDSEGRPQQDDTGFIDSGSSRNMTGNIAYLLDFKEFDEGYVTFGGGAHGGSISTTIDDQMLWHRYIYSKEEISQDCIVMPIWKDASYFDSLSKDVGNSEPKSATDDQKLVENGPHNESDEKDKSEDDSSPNTASSNDQDSPKDMFKLGASHTLETAHVEFFIPTTLNTRIHKDHPIKNVIGDVKSSIQTRRMTKSTSEQGFLNAVYEQKMHDTLNTCIYDYFLSQIEPTSIAKALSDSSWVEATQEELLQFKLQQVWKHVDLPNGKKAIGTKWVFRNKKYERGIVITNKASAFLYGTIEEEVYVTQSLGFKDLDNPDKVYKVVKALYGLHQAPRAWYETLANYLLGNGFKRGKIDQTLFIKKQKGDILLVQVYVDDIIFGFTNKDLCTGFEKLTKEKFQITSMAEIMFAVCACARF
ncbi:ribonuclease H-like domain-containing protein [Tanacetum coccineum]